ncbi:MAG TPA: hypothetical protein VF491_07725 [Vicinamibacterales bacterium]|jgi:hypothetical protein
MSVPRRTPAIVFLALLVSGAAFAQGTKPVPKPAPKTAKPPAKTAPAAQKPLPHPPAPAPPSDVRFKSTYTNGDQVTESATFVRENRERYELGDTILLKQRDQKRTVQISKSSSTYLVTPEGSPAAPPPADAAAATPPGVIVVDISVVDLGDRKNVFGQEARHVRTVINRQPEAGACDQSKMLMETDGWYINMPKSMAAAPAETPAPPRAGCADELKTNVAGDAALLGFPVNYKTTFTSLDSKDAKPMAVSMDVTEFEIVRLDPSLFEIPDGLTEAANPQQLAKAISDANEVKLAQTPEVIEGREKKPGTLRVGVPEFANKTTQTVDTRALRTRLVAELEEQKIDVIPMAAAPMVALEARAKDLSVDYLLLAEITELKVSKPGGLTKVMKNTAGEGARDITEAKLNVQLVAPGTKPRLSKTNSGKDGGVGLKTTLGLAKLAGTLYLRMYMGGMYGSQLSAFSTMNMMNLGGMGNPSLMQMQSGMGAGRFGGSGVDRTAGAAMFVMQQAMAGAAAGASQGGPSFDSALDQAIQDAGKDVVESVKKAAPVRK